MLNRILDRLLIGMACVAAGILVLMTASIVYEVVMRYFLVRPTKWAIEFSEYALFYILFLVAAWVLTREGHVKIEILVNRLPLKTQRVLNTITSVIGALLCGMLFWYGLQITWDAFEVKSVFMRAIITPRWPILIVLPFGSLLLTLQFFRRAWDYARGSKVPEGGG